MSKTKRSIQWIKEKPSAVHAQQKYAGIHLIADFWGGKVTENSKNIERILIGATKAAENIPLKVSIHKFYPQGITGVVLLAESHIALHSWPEFDYLAIDIFTCGDKAKPYKALKYLRRRFKPKKVEIYKIERGNHGRIKKFIS